MYIFRHNKAICGYVVVGGVENLMGNFDWKERKRWNRKKLQILRLRRYWLRKMRINRKKFITNMLVI